MGDRSNVSHRVLNAVRTATGAERSLENFIGLALVDGAQCFVTEEEANYRWLAKSVLVPDGRFVVKASGPNEQGRWVRESGLVGFAMLEGGAGEPLANGQGIVFGNYVHEQLVQFEMQNTVTSWGTFVARSLIYRGAVKRLAMMCGSAQLDFERGSLSLEIYLHQDDVWQGRIAAQRIEMSGVASVSCAALINPGAKIALYASGPCGKGGLGSLRVVLA